MIPKSSITFLAIRSFSVESLRSLAKTGGPEVGMERETPWEGVFMWELGVVSSRGTRAGP